MPIHLWCKCKNWQNHVVGIDFKNYALMQYCLFCGSKLEKDSKASDSAVTIEQMIGGGDSWFYALKNGKVLGAAHRDDRVAMQRLHDIQEQNSQKAKENLYDPKPESPNTSTSKS